MKHLAITLWCVVFAMLASRTEGCYSGNPPIIRYSFNLECDCGCIATKDSGP
jgi:hypothetical protein